MPVCVANGGLTAVAAERGEVKATRMGRLQRKEDRLKSVLPRPSVRIALLALRFYKAYLSFLFAGNCRFHPTCSQYAYEAIERFGVSRGVWMGLKRLLRCHPLSRKFGYDPVPERWNEAALYAKQDALESVTAHSAEIPHEVHS